MDDPGEDIQNKLSQPQDFGGVFNSFDITDVRSLAEKNPESETNNSDKTKEQLAEKKNGGAHEMNGSGDHFSESASKDTHISNTNIASDTSLKNDGSKSSNTTQTKKPAQNKRKKGAKAAEDKIGKTIPVVAIKEEKEDPSYNNAMKNVITMTTPSAVVTTSIPVSGINLIPNSLLGKNTTTSTQQKTLLIPRSMIASGGPKVKIAPRPKAPMNPPKFAFIPVTNPNPRSQTSRTVTLYVPPNLLNTSSGTGGIRLPSPHSLMELLHRSGPAATGQAVRPPTTTQASQSGLVNAQPRMSSQIAATTKPKHPQILPRPPIVSPNNVVLFNKASREMLMKMISREHLPRHQLTVPPPELELQVNKHICPCGDEFISLAGLENHSCRKSATIRFHCDLCTTNQDKVFSNPCLLILHVQSHGKSLNETLNRNMLCQVLPLGKSYNNLPLAPELNDLIDLSKDEPRNSTSKTPVVAVQQIVPAPAVQPETQSTPSKTVSLLAENTKSPEKSTVSENHNMETSKFTSGDSTEKGNSKETDVVTVGDEENDVQMTVVTETRTENVEEKYDYCPYCRVILEKGTALERHFQTAEPCQSEEVQEYTCQTCNRMLPNPCSFQAHQAFHNKTRPFVCPECGVIINGTVETYMKHVQDKCMHNMHMLRFGCTKCPKKKKKFSSRKQLLEHIEDHGETYVKCLHCPMAFRSMETLKDHSSKTHTISDVTETDYKSIFKCALCDTVYQEAEQRRTHLTTHNKDLKVFLLYRCNKSNCGANRVFITKVRIREHLQERHDIHVLIHLCDTCGMQFDTADQLKDHLDTNHTEANKCIVCEEKCQSQEEFCKHMEQHDRMGIISSPKPQERPQSPAIIRKRKSTESSVSPAAKKVKSPPYVPSCQVEAEEDSRFYCSDCKLKFLRQGVLQEHMRIVHSVQPQFPCHLCGATYDSHTKLQKHVKQHEGKAKEQVHYMCWICQKNKSTKISRYSKRSILEKHLAGYHKLIRSQIDWSNLKVTGNTQSEAGSEAEGDTLHDSETAENDEPIKRLKVDGDTEFTCAKCTFVCEIREEFLSHIPQHKTEDESHQCQECGMCFMVLPSLKRHLLVVHRVLDFMKYFQESGLNLETPPPEDRSKSMRPKFPVNGSSTEQKFAEDGKDIDIPDDFECRVCYKQFDSEKALHNHMRVHGMAFIRSKRMDNPI